MATGTSFGTRAEHELTPEMWRANWVGPSASPLRWPRRPRSAGQETAEAYLVFAEAAEDITSAKDPRVVQFLDQQLGQMLPFLKRSGESEKIRAGAAPGILVTWEGDNPKGMTVHAHAFATVLKGYGIALVGLGDRKQIAAREKTLRGIFASFAAGEGQKDPQLVGMWKEQSE